MPVRCPRNFASGWLVLLLFLSASAPAFAKQYALLVAVNQYGRDTGFNSLAYPETDIALLAETLKKSGYEPNDIVQLSAARFRETSLPGSLPTADNIRKELELLLETLQRGDSLLLAFSGHGVMFKGSEESFFCPMDVDLSRKKNLLSLTEIYEQLEQARHLGMRLLFCDACRNDPVSGSVKSAESLSRPRPVNPPGGVAAFFSCSGGQASYEDKGLKGGVFFHYLIQGMQGHADGDQNQEVDLEELVKFTRQRVLDYVRVKYGAPQRPEFLSRSNAEVVFRVPAGFKPASETEQSEPSEPNSPNSPAGNQLVRKFEASGQGGISEIMVRQGDKVSITARGSWSMGGFLGSCGPDGLTLPGTQLYNQFPSEAIHGKLMMKVVGEESWHSIGRSGSFVAASSGALIWTPNDQDPSNNTGALEVTVTIERSGDSSQPTTPEPVAKAKTVSVPANSSEFASGLTVKKGQRVRIDAVGSWRMGALIGFCSPNGFGNNAFFNYSRVASAPHGCLMVGIRGQKTWELTAGSGSFTASASGELVFAPNDTQVSNNSGTITVKVLIED